MSRTISPVTGKPYGLALVCRVWRLARSGVYRHQSVPPARQRRGPIGAMSDDALTTAIQDVLAASEEGVVPVGQRRRRDTELARNCLQVFALLGNT